MYTPVTDSTITVPLVYSLYLALLPLEHDDDSGETVTMLLELLGAPVRVLLLCENHGAQNTLCTRLQGFHRAVEVHQCAQEV